MFDLVSPHLCELQGFLGQYSEALQNASLLLGGNPAAMQTGRLIDEISSAVELSSRSIQGLKRLYELLTLEHVHDPSRPEAAFFAVLDPAASYVEDICLLSDALYDVVLGCAKIDLLDPVLGSEQVNHVLEGTQSMSVGGAV